MDFRKLRNELFKRTERYASGVRALYDKALAEIAKEFANMEYDPSRVFSFDEVGKFGRVDDIMRRLERQIEQVVEKGISTEFGEAYNGCDKLIRQVVGNRMNEEIAKAFSPRVLSGNAAKVFIKANKAGNITASQRVWNGAALGQMETAVEEGLMEGMPATRMAKLLEEYLVDPDSCFRRFRIKTGVDAEGKSMYGRKWKKRIIHQDGSTTWKDADPRDYPVGSGVYHSSYKNAMRYARTTTNIAYRTADHDRYQDLPFITGIEIKTSGNHPESDICDELAGKYPKDFLWTGWHPNCRCYQVPILAKPDEVEKMADAITEGEDPEKVPVEGRITDVPDNFKGWIDRNGERIKNAQKLPYFLRDNGTMDKQGVWHVKQFDQQPKQPNLLTAQKPINELSSKWFKPMAVLYDKKTVVNGNGHTMSVGFKRYGNKHIFYDTYTGKNNLSFEDLANVDKLLSKSIFIRKSRLYKDRNDKIERFYYYKTEYKGKTLYLQVAEEEFITKKGKRKFKRYLYSITDSLTL